MLLLQEHLTTQDATTLKAELDHVASMEAAYKAETGGALTPRQIQVLATELATAQAHVDQQVKLGESAIPQLTNRRTTILQRLTDATASGKLSASDSAAIKSELDQVAAKQDAFIGAGNVLTGSQVLMLASQLDAAQAHLDAKLAGTAGIPPVAGGISTAEIDLKRTDLDSKIKELVRAGVFSPAIASDYGVELEQIGTLEQAYKASSGGITAAQIQQLLSNLDRLSYRLNRQSRMAQAGPGGGYGGGFGGAYAGQGGRSGGVYGDGSGRGYGGPDASYGGGFGYRGGRVGEQPGSLPANVDIMPTTAPPAVPQNPAINLPLVSPKDFNDVAGYWAQPYVNELASRAVIGGFPDGSFKPNAEITRSQFASIVTHALNLPTGAAGNNFTDVPAKHWAASSIAAVANAGLVGGFPDGTFHPEDKLTRAQALVILAKALHRTVAPNSSALDPYSDKQAVPSWASDSIITAAQAHIIANFPDASQIRPNALATRGEVAALMYQTLTALGANLPKNKIGVL